MDFLRLVRSLEELLYEVMAWLVFYPRTLWRIVVHPVAMMRYSDDEQADVVTEQYTDTLSPPLFLMLTILLAHGFEIGMGLKMPEARTPVAKILLSSEQNLLIMRAILFSIFALVAATTVIRRRTLALTRTTLRGPFFGQCYLTAPFALAVSGSTLLGRMPTTTPRLAGTALAAAGIVWYLWVQTGWFRRQLDVGTGRAFLTALGTFARATIYCVVVASVLLVLKWQ